MKTADLAALPANAAPLLAADASHASARKGRALMLFSVAFFVANALVVRTLTDRLAIDSWIVTATRFVVGLGLVFLPGMPTGRPRMGRVLRNPWLVARGLVGGTGVFLYYHTVAILGVGRATFISTTYVVWGAVLASIFLREKMRPAVVAALVLGVIGVALLTGVATGGLTMSTGDALALIGALSSAVVVVIIRKLHQTESTGSIFAAQCTWGLAVAAAPATLHWETPAAIAIVVLVVSGLLAGGGQLTMTAAYRHLPVAEGSLLQLLGPFGIGAGGALLFGERYTVTDGLGALLIIAGCLLTVRTRPRLSAGLPATAK